MTDTIGVFQQVSTVGTPAAGGSAVFDHEMQTYTVTGAGRTEGQADAFSLVARTLETDFILTVTARFAHDSTQTQRALGIMVRQTLEPDAAHASAVLRGDDTVAMQYRLAPSEPTCERAATISDPEVLQIERAGDLVITRAATRGGPLIEIGQVRCACATVVLAGVFVCAHETSETAVFSNVRFDVPVPHGLDANTFPAASRLEVLELATLRRQVVFSSDQHFEAPNWSRDGSYLLFNQHGRIYKLLLGADSPQLLETGHVLANNNDHGISFDGKRLALSSHTEAAGRKAGSQIFVVDIDGGEPVQITSEAPSYWHGWSPDGRTLLYCAERDGNHDVYAISATGGPETRLTTEPGLDDGPEFSPDGRCIYFNSTRSGHMKIWRMQPDGSQQEQLSFGDGHDWFAHPSPDGRRLVFVTYPPSVPAASHPPNQRVSIREQDLENAEVRVLAHLYGGQGTMNVPSWSPDGSCIAFVSYTCGDPCI